MRQRQRWKWILKDLVRSCPVSCSVLLCVTLYIMYSLIRSKPDSTLFPAVSPDTADDRTLEYMSDHLIVRYDVINNLVDNRFVHLTLHNNGNMFIPSKLWSIYFYSILEVEKGLADCGLIVSHDNGQLHHLSPAPSFKGIGPGKGIVCKLGGTISISRTDHFPNWYVSSRGRKPRVLKSTLGEGLEYVSELRGPNQWKRVKEDRYNPYTADDRYNRYRTVDSKGPGYHVIPTPSDVRVDQSIFMEYRQMEWAVLNHATFENEVKFLSAALKLPIKSSSPPKRYIYFSKSDVQLTDPEAYELRVKAKDEVIEIVATDSTGAFYGVQSLISVLYGKGAKIANMTIKDKPRYPYRGVMVDVARNFRSKATILQLLDVMALYKLNRFHIHLTDDEGWRLEIPGIPELTEIGGKRCHDEDQTACLLPSLGSGPDSFTSGSGYYSVADYREILQYAKDRHIVVIPEVDVPGHARAAIHAMDVREKRIASEKDPTMPSYLLRDHHSSVESVQKWKDSSVNPCLDTTYSFIEKVVNEIIKIHKDIQPLRVFHIGGDEVPPGAWKGSPACQKQFPTVSEMRLTDVLKDHFVKRLSAIVEKNLISVMAWEDGLLDTDDRPYRKSSFSRDPQVIAWSNIWNSGREKYAYEFANEGYKVVLALATHLYFDIAQEPDPEERGLYWSTRFIDSRKVFGLLPSDVYSNADVNGLGVPIQADKLCEKAGSCPRLNNPQNIIGLQGCLWGELMRTDEQFHYMGFPRILALAEQAWHEAPWEKATDASERTRLRDDDWGRFANTLGYKELPRLEEHGILHRVAPPGAIVEGGNLKVNSLYPGTVIERFNILSNSWESVQGSTQLDKGRHVIKLRARSRVLGRHSREVRAELDVP